MLLKRLILLVCCVGLLAGCALSPQQLTPNPVIVDKLAVNGQGRAIQLRVVDERAGEVIGTRGGLYADTSNVSVSKAFLVDTMQEKAKEALTNMGYRIADSQSSAPVLTIIIDSITYKAPAGTFVRSAEVTVVLRSKLETAPKTYNGRYMASVSQDFATAPDLSVNNKLVAETLASALYQVLTDTRGFNEL